MYVGSKWWERVVYAPEAKKSEFLVNLDHFSKFLKYFKYFEKWSKLTKNLDFFTSDYSRIKIDHIADSLLKLQIKIGVHLINVELSQLLTLVDNYVCQQKIVMCKNNGTFARSLEFFLQHKYLGCTGYFKWEWCKILSITPKKMIINEFIR